MSAAEDQQIRLAIGGDAEALSALLEQFALQNAAALARKIETRWRTILEVDDVLQTTFLEAFMRIRQCRADHAASFFAWVRTIAEHNLTDAIRGLRCEKRPPLDRRVWFDDIHAACVPDDTPASLYDENGKPKRNK